jgi:hypothetical protein
MLFASANATSESADTKRYVFCAGCRLECFMSFSATSMLNWRVNVFLKVVPSVPAKRKPRSIAAPM